MNVLQLTTWDQIGRQFNGYELHRELMNKHVPSNMLVLSKQHNEAGIVQLGNRISRVFDAQIMHRLERALSVHSLLPLTGLGLYANPHFRDADILHLQLVYSSSFLSLLHLPVLARLKRVIWTLHDPFIMTGHCLHPMDCHRWQHGCGECPDLNRTFPIKRDTTAFQWQLKHWLMHRSDIELVISSKWMERHLQQSPILSHLPYTIIPFGVDLDVFQPKNRCECREHLGIAQDAQVLFYRYRGEDEPYKGWPVLQQALLKMQPKRPTVLLTIDKTGDFKHLSSKYQVIQLGWLKNQDALVDALSASDLFLMPSMAESFGMMALEAMACGVPVITFKTTSVEEVIHAPEGGVAVDYADADALAKAIAELLDNDPQRQTLSRQARELAVREYDRQLYLDRHMKLYGVS